MITLKQLGQTEALALIRHAMEAVTALGKTAAIAVVDTHGELLAYLKMDGCGHASGQIAMNKAFTSARDKQESGALGSASKTWNFPLTWLGDIRFCGFAGGLPIYVDGSCVGAIGISGMAEDEDIKVARDAVAKLGL